MKKINEAIIDLELEFFLKGVYVPSEPEVGAGADIEDLELFMYVGPYVRGKTRGSINISYLLDKMPASDIDDFKEKMFMQRGQQLIEDKEYADELKAELKLEEIKLRED